MYTTIIHGRTRREMLRTHQACGRSTYFSTIRSHLSWLTFTIAVSVEIGYKRCASKRAPGHSKRNIQVCNVFIRRNFVRTLSVPTKENKHEPSYLEGASNAVLFPSLCRPRADRKPTHGSKLSTELLEKFLSRLYHRNNFRVV